MAVSYRVVGGPTPQSDNKMHDVTLTDNVAAGETLVLLVAHSVNTTTGNTGSVSDPGGHVWEFNEVQNTSPNRGTEVFSSYCENGLSSGQVVGYYVKGNAGGASDGTYMWHGMSPYAMLVALSSGDTRRMVYDTSQVSGGTNVTRCPTGSGTLTSADDAVVLAFHSTATTGAANWWAQSEAGWTEIADTAEGTETLFKIACDARVASTAWTGFSNGTPASQALSHILISYKALAVDETSTGRIFPSTAATASETGHADQNITNPGNVTADDSSNATITGNAWDVPDETYVLKAQGFDFSAVPDGATINGVVARVSHWQPVSPPCCSIDLVQLLDTTGARVGDNLADLPTLSINRPLHSNTTQVYAFGSSTNLWSNALDSAWVKDADFGFAIGYKAGTTNANLTIDYVTLEVFYTGSEPAALSADSGSYVLTGADATLLYTQADWPPAGSPAGSPLTSSGAILRPL